MGRSKHKPSDLARAIGLATWLMPPHRKDWAAAMLNEIAYVASRRIAWHWVLGCIFLALRERASYELASALAPRTMLKALLQLSAMSFLAVAGLYMLQKPYQRERILFVVFHHGARPAHHVKPTVDERAPG